MSSRLLRGTGVGVVAALALLLPAAAAAADGPQPVQLRAQPADQSGPYFDLTMQPGESRQVTVVLGNNSSERVRARTYAADAYTIVNGGFGAELRDGQPGGTTTWLTYPTEVLTLPAGGDVERPVVVTVPPDAAPGEYVSSVVLENEDPVRGSGSVALDQVVRQAVAVAVRVPGPVSAGLSVGRADHEHVAGRSVVAVEVANTGSVRLTPAAEVVVSDSAATPVGRATVPMDSFYAGTATKVEITLSEALRPGAYSVDVVLHDAARDVRAEASALPLVVDVVPAAASAASTAQQVVDVLQRARRSPEPALLVAGAVLLTIAVVVGVRVSGGRGRTGRHVRRAPGSGSAAARG